MRVHNFDRKRAQNAHAKGVGGSRSALPARPKLALALAPSGRPSVLPVERYRPLGGPVPRNATDA